jgi:RHS repeat-associated protein
MLTDASNTVVWEGVCKPFGEAEVNPNSSVVCNFRFPGQYFDSETGLHYNFHRYYDPVTGRYLTPDPLNLVTAQLTKKNPLTTNFITLFYQRTLSNPQALNFYVYSLNDPINAIDPYGLVKWGKLATGFLSIADGLIMVGVAFAVPTGTFVITKNPKFTAVVGTMMLPVLYGGYLDIKHGIHHVYEAFDDEISLDKSIPCE